MFSSPLSSERNWIVASVLMIGVLMRPVPVTAISFTEGFDSVPAPALPGGWSTSGTAPTWAITTNMPDTAPNAAFVDAPSSITDKRLVSPAFVITTSGALLSFRHSYNTESAFDGGVLEISISGVAGGAFQDIVVAGGSWANSGGYNATLSNLAGNPLGGRMAWSGNSNGYITTLVILPAIAAGRTVQLQWRMGTDAANSGTGWQIDTIRLLDCQITCVDITVPADEGQCGAIVNYAPASAPGCTGLSCLPAVGSFFPIGKTVVQCQTAENQTCQIIVTVTKRIDSDGSECAPAPPNGAGPSCGVCGGGMPPMIMFAPPIVVLSLKLCRHRRDNRR